MSDWHIKLTNADMEAGHRFSITLDDIALIVGDMSLTSYALLTCVSERSEGILIKEVKQHYTIDIPVEHHLAMLESEELLERSRDAADRRAFCLKATDKGKQRILLVDECIAHAVIGMSPRFTESSFSQFTAAMYAYATSMSRKNAPHTFIPGMMLALVANLRVAFVEESSIYGLNTMQTGLLASIAASSDACSLEYLSPKEGPAETMVEVQLSDLERKSLVLFHDGYWELTERGHRRLVDIEGRLSARINVLLSPLSEDQAAALKKVLQLGLYLIS